MGNCLSKFNYSPPFILHMPPLTAGYLKKVDEKSIFHLVYIETMGIKDLHTVLRVAL